MTEDTHKKTRAKAVKAPAETPEVAPTEAPEGAGELRQFGQFQFYVKG